MAVLSADRKGLVVTESLPDSPAQRESLPRNVMLLGVVSLLNDTASEMIYPLLPLGVPLSSSLARSNDAKR